MKDYAKKIAVANSKTVQIREFQKSITQYHEASTALDMMKPAVKDKRSKEWKNFTKASKPIEMWKGSILRELPTKSIMKQQLEVEITNIKSEIRNDILLMFRPKKRRELLSQLERV